MESQNVQGLINNKNLYKYIDNLTLRYYDTEMRYLLEAGEDFCPRST